MLVSMVLEESARKVQVVLVPAVLDQGADVGSLKSYVISVCLGHPVPAKCVRALDCVPMKI
jgi:hypothetical protein